MERNNQRQRRADFQARDSRRRVKSARPVDGGCKEQAAPVVLEGEVTHVQELPESTVVLAAKMRRLDPDGHEALQVALVDGTGATLREILVKPENFDEVSKLTGYVWATDEDLAQLIGCLNKAQLVVGYDLASLLELLASQGLAVHPRAWMDVREEWTRQQIECGKLDGSEPKAKLVVCAIRTHYHPRIVTVLDEARATQHILSTVIKQNANSVKDERHAIRVYCFFALVAAFFAVLFVVRGDVLVSLLCALIAIYLVSMLPNLRRKCQDAKPRRRSGHDGAIAS